MPNALLGGAAAILTDRPLADISLPQCIVADPRRAYAELCHALYGFPSRRLGLVGITGTNGKTTTAWLIRCVLENSGQAAGVLGTIQYSDGVDAVPAQLTTPDSLTLARWLGAMEERQTRFGALELSSHALDQDRTAGVSLDAAIVTNITHDHFDYHPNREHYVRSKARIAELLKKSGVLIVNEDDEGSREALQHVHPAPRVMTFGIEHLADVSAVILDQGDQGTRFILRTGTERVECRTSLIGRHNVENCLAAAAALLHLGISLADIASGIAACKHVPGRLQAIPSAHPFNVFVDYAHTDDALRRVLSAVRPLTSGRIILVFGAGGDRDRTKRAPMGRAAGLADIAVLTSDNPRGEDPLQIIRDVAAGLAQVTGNCHVDVDRRSAIEWALSNARAGDSVIIAGKGHERTQILGSEYTSFDDVAVCNDWLHAHPPEAASAIPSPKFIQHADGILREQRTTGIGG